jgi:hypothetical protein
MSQAPLANTGNDLVEKIRREFPDLDTDRAHRIVKIFAEHMRETIKKVTTSPKGTLGSLMGPKD